MANEKLVKRKVKKILEEIGAYYAMAMGTGFGNSGIPDFLVCFAGSFIGIEAKYGGNIPTRLQVSNLDKIVRAGGRACVVDEKNINFLKEWIIYGQEKTFGFEQDSGSIG